MQRKANSNRPSGPFESVCKRRGNQKHRAWCGEKVEQEMEHRDWCAEGRKANE